MQSSFLLSSGALSLLGRNGRARDRDGEELQRRLLVLRAGALARELEDELHDRGQLLRRSREFSEARERFLTTLRSYEDRLILIGQEKAEAMHLAQEMHRELEAFESKQQQLDKILSDLDEAKQEAGFWSIFHINQLLERMRSLLRGGDKQDG